MTKHTHYHKGVQHLDTLDVYRVLDLFNVTHPALQHAAKKILCAGQRGSKGFDRDLQEAIDSINRALQMIEEDRGAGMQGLCAKLKATEQRGWPGIPEAAELVAAQAALKVSQEAE